MLPDLIETIERRIGKIGSLFVTRRPGDATIFARFAAEDTCKLLIVIGGDGTVQEIVNGLIENGKLIVNECQAGIGASVVRSLNSKHKRFGGRFAFGFEVLKKTFHQLNHELTVILDDAPPIRGQFIGIVIANDAYTAGGMNLAPSFRATLQNAGELSRYEVITRLLTVYVCMRSFKFSIIYRNYVVEQIIKEEKRRAESVSNMRALGG